jgi:hypothetical protein
MEQKAIVSVLDQIRNEGYLIGTDKLLDREGKSWAIFDLEQNCLFKSPVLLPAAQMFVLLETPDVILDIIEKEPEIIIEAEEPRC